MATCLPVNVGTVANGDRSPRERSDSDMIVVGRRRRELMAALSPATDCGWGRFEPSSLGD